MLIPHKGHTDTIQVYSVTVMTHVKALQAGHSSQGTSEPITPALFHYGLIVQDFPQSCAVGVYKLATYPSIRTGGWGGAEPLPRMFLSWWFHEVSIKI